MAAPARDPITCHVLDTTTGRPGPNIAVQLVCTTVPDIIFHCKTNHDGRIANWESTQGVREGLGASIAKKDSVGAALESMIKEYGAVEDTPSCPKGASIWKLKFDTGSYYGVSKTFFPTVELTFLVKEGEHFHVPLLLGPYSFTTYRGS